jgi:diaminohydroxyphosphoribosylaminopyrimidine deaminase/5-amino-6-(5-phosphoribosylamino)uracil reductase
VVSRDGDLPASSHLFTDEHRDRTRVFRNQPLSQVLEVLGQEQITSVLIEGGGTVLGEAVDGRLIDEVQFYLAPLLCGGPTVIAGAGAGASAESILLSHVRYRRIGDDIHLSAYPIKS